MISSLLSRNVVITHGYPDRSSQPITFRDHAVCFVLEVKLLIESPNAPG
jgi:hypothetical protein